METKWYLCLESQKVVENDNKQLVLISFILFLRVVCVTLSNCKLFKVTAQCFKVVSLQGGQSISTVSSQVHISIAFEPVGYPIWVFIKKL